MRECPILVAMSVVFGMPSMRKKGQGCDARNGKLAEHLVQNRVGILEKRCIERCRPLAMDLVF